MPIVNRQAQRVKILPDKNMIRGYERRPKVATVLLPPGLGDIHWVMLKLEGFLRERGYESADVWIWDVGGPRRSEEFVQRVPFVNFIDYVHLRSYHREIHEFCVGENPLIERRWGFDFTIALNGYLEHGLPIEDALGVCAINWRYPIQETKREQSFAVLHHSRGPWMLMYFSALAQAFGRWAEIVTPKRVRELAHILKAEFPDHRILMVGLPWDKGFADQIDCGHVESLVGKTSTDEYFALLRGASGMIGFANGNTILTSYFDVPTVMIWNNDRFPHMGFRTNWVKPGCPYLPMEIDDWDAEKIVATISSFQPQRELQHV